MPEMAKLHKPGADSKVEAGGEEQVDEDLSPEHAIYSVEDCIHWATIPRAGPDWPEEIT
jgi:hypothetical protein